MKKLLLPFLLLSVFTSLQAHAFSLSDHKRIMLQALTEFDVCYPGQFTPKNEDDLWRSDLAEDLNILRKDLVYSHFYNPYKKLQMWRADSSVRVKDIVQELRRSVQASTWNQKANVISLGHALHQIQDMAAPPHVVPVMHGLNDGFEKYDFAGDISSGLSCADIAQMSDTLVQVHQNAATQTLINLQGVQVPGSSGPVSSALTLVNIISNFFWNPSPADSPKFGKYGVLGNHYGQTSFVQDKIQYSVPAQFYSDFKQQQLKQAVQSTLQGLAWYLTLSK